MAIDNWNAERYYDSGENIGEIVGMVLADRIPTNAAPSSTSLSLIVVGSVTCIDIL